MSEPSPLKNQLAGEASAYLRQHASNPIAWQVWGEEALAYARTHRLPIFLSIGYSACHWCHVMEKESFRDELFAEFLNRNFVCIKVDREERPDVDSLFMSAVQSMTGQGGWPLNVFLSPDALPFFGGTYFPPEAKFGRPGFRELCLEIARIWSEQPKELDKQAKQLAQRLANHHLHQSHGRLSSESLRDVLIHLEKNFDATYGGFGSAPKFPPYAALELLLNQFDAEDPGFVIVEKTLDAIALGGMRDHLGNGFFRYSTDAKWLVPHFEKMLYDNAQLARLYSMANLKQPKRLWKEAAESAWRFINQDLALENGAFGSSFDADTHGEEGAYYLFTAGEIRDCLGEDTEAFMRAYGATEAGHIDGKNIVHLSEHYEEVLKDVGEAKLQQWQALLLAKRQSRQLPNRDEKRVLAWNAMALRAALLLSSKQELHEIEATALFLFEEHRDDDGVFRRNSYGSELGKSLACLEDLAQLGALCLELYEQLGTTSWLEHAQEIAVLLEGRYLREDGCLVSSIAPDIWLHTREADDGSTPSAQAEAIRFLHRLSLQLKDDHFAELAAHNLHSFADAVRQHGNAHALLLIAASELEHPPLSIALINIPNASGDEKLNQERLEQRIKEAFLPGAALFLRASKQQRATWMPEVLPQGPAVLVCGSGGCLPPIREVSELSKTLSALEKGWKREVRSNWHGAFDESKSTQPKLNLCIGRHPAPYEKLRGLAAAAFQGGVRRFSISCGENRDARLVLHEIIASARSQGIPRTEIKISAHIGIFDASDLALAKLQGKAAPKRQLGVERWHSLEAPHLEEQLDALTRLLGISCIDQLLVDLSPWSDLSEKEWKEAINWLRLMQQENRAESIGFRFLQLPSLQFLANILKEIGTNDAHFSIQLPAQSNRSEEFEALIKLCQGSDILLSLNEPWTFPDAPGVKQRAVPPPKESGNPSLWLELDEVRNHENDFRDRFVPILEQFRTSFDPEQLFDFTGQLDLEDPINQSYFQWCELEIGLRALLARMLRQVQAALPREAAADFERWAEEYSDSVSILLQGIRRRASILSRQFCEKLFAERSLGGALAGLPAALIREAFNRAEQVELDIDASSLPEVELAWKAADFAFAPPSPKADLSNTH